MEQKLFETPAAFRQWLEANGATSKGFWLIFGKKDGPTTLTANEALEEALCCGWIDGQIKSVDERTYLKYFSPRRKGSNWSERNKAMVASLEAQGRMGEEGRARVEEAKKDGTWDAPKGEPVTADQIDAFASHIKGTEPAYTNFLAMSPSVKRTYTASYLDTKSDEARARRLEKIIARLNQNLKPM